MKHLFELILRLTPDERLHHPEIFDIVEMGKLHISTNSVVVCDPLYYYNSYVPLEQKVPNGEFISELYYANEIVGELQDYQDRNPCFSLIRFSDMPIKYWKMAVSTGQNTDNLERYRLFWLSGRIGNGLF